jgi:hypothetical protein
VQHLKPHITIGFTYNLVETISSSSPQSLSPVEFWTLVALFGEDHFLLPNGPDPEGKGRKQHVAALPCKAKGSTAVDFPVSRLCCCIEAAAEPPSPRSCAAVRITLEGTTWYYSSDFQMYDFPPLRRPTAFENGQGTFFVGARISRGCSADAQGLLWRRGKNTLLVSELK